MKYVYVGGQYTEFRGYVFKWGQPTTILDKGTLLAIARRPDFKEYVEPAAPVAEPKSKTLRLPRKVPS
jgi:hypothetical protein